MNPFGPSFTLKTNKQKISNWYASNDHWGLQSKSKELNRIQLLLSEIPSLSYKKTLLVSWRTTQEQANKFPGKKIEWYSMMDVKGEKPAIASAEGLYELLQTFRSKHQSYDLIIVDRIMYTGVIGNSLNLAQLYFQDLLKKDGILVSCCLETFAPPRFPMLLYQESFMDLRTCHYRVRTYLQ